jgi:small-conductance mechanosensitive channel
VKEREEKGLQLQKAESAKLKKAAPLYKLKIAQEKRVVREAAKVVREKEKTERAKQVAERARQRDAQDTTKAPQLSKWSNRKALQPLEQNIKRKEQVVDAVGGGEASGAALAAHPRQRGTAATSNFQINISSTS